MSMQRGSDWLGNLVTPDEYAIAVERFTYRRGDETETFTIDGLSDFVGALFDLASSRVTQQQQAAPGAVPDGWKPIETAPKDGTVILVTDTFTYRSDPEKKPHHVYRAVRWNEEGYGWEIYNDGEIIDQDGPTFWMPLPAEPGAMLSASPTAPEATKSAYTKALEIRTAQGWKLTGEAIPVLYTDTINDQQVMRDDVWLCTTAALRQSEAAKPEPQAQAGEPGNNKGKSNGRNDKQGPALGANLPLGGSPDASVACSTYSSLSSLTDVLWGSNDVMSLNAELGLTMDQLVRIANVVLQSHREAIAKKDAALQACLVHMLIAYGQNSHDMILTGDELRGLHAAIIQAEEARK